METLGRVRLNVVTKAARSKLFCGRGLRVSSHGMARTGLPDFIFQKVMTVFSYFQKVNKFMIAFSVNVRQG